MKQTAAMNIQIRAVYITYMNNKQLP